MVLEHSPAAGRRLLRPRVVAPAASGPWLLRLVCRGAARRRRTDRFGWAGFRLVVI